VFGEGIEKREKNVICIKAIHSRQINYNKENLISEPKSTKKIKHFI
jgi:hypothetical protein